MGTGLSWRRGTTSVAVVAFLYCLFMTSGLLVVWRHARESRPLDHPELLALRAELDQQPTSTSLTETIRACEEVLRREHLRRMRQLQVGAWLLLAGMAVFAVAAPLAVTARRRFTMPVGPRNAEPRYAVASRVTVVVVALALAGTAAALPHLLAPAREVERAEGVWPGFRGAGGSGVSPYADVPVSFDAREGQERSILWKSVVPLPGLSSPIVWNERVFVTGGTESAREVYCYDALTGRQLWRRPVSAGPESSRIPENVNRDTGYAAPTPVTDGKHVWAGFANGDVVCLDFFGKQVWCVHLGTPVNMYGHAASPLLEAGRIVVQLDQDSGREGPRSALIALDAATGAESWRTPREVESSWPSPIVIETSSKGRQILTCANPFVIAYDPATGKEVWRFDGVEGDGGPSPAFGEGLVFAVNVASPLTAIRPDGRGDVTETHAAWTWDEGLPDVCSPLVGDGLLWLQSTDGLTTCLDAKTGARVWEKELKTSFYASASLAGGRVYLISRKGELIVLAAGREFREVARGHVGERCDSSPAFAEGRMYVRGVRHLICAGEETP